jgi:hypothetical protein
MTSMAADPFVGVGLVVDGDVVDVGAAAPAAADWDYFE